MSNSMLPPGVQMRSSGEDPDRENIMNSGLQGDVEVNNEEPGKNVNYDEILSSVKPSKKKRIKQKEPRSKKKMIICLGMIAVLLVGVFLFYYIGNLQGRRAVKKYFKGYEKRNIDYLIESQDEECLSDDYMVYLKTYLSDWGESSKYDISYKITSVEAMTDDAIKESVNSLYSEDVTIDEAYLYKATYHYENVKEDDEYDIEIDAIAYKKDGKWYATD